MRADFYLGDWIVRPRRGCIERGEEVVRVHPKAMAVLECLANAEGEVVTRDELHDAVWPGVIVTDDSLTQCVAELRKAFGDSAKESQIIKTIPKAGFCLIPPVETLVDRKSTRAIHIRKWLLGFSAIIVLLMVVSIWRISEVRKTEHLSTAPQQSSLAILPFANRSANADDAFFVDGIHDELLTHIAKLGSIKTISRTSVMQYRDVVKTIPEIAAELGVSTILEGSVQRAGEQVRINVQLIDAQTDDHLWSETYDRQLLTKNIFAIQTEIAQAIAAKLKATLSPEQELRLSLVPTQNLEAYEAFLRGKKHLEARENHSLDESTELFQKAIHLDPNFAIAWVGLANTYQLKVVNGGLPGTELLPKAETALQKALQIDEQLAEAHAALGLQQLILGEHELSEYSFRRALDLNPNYAQAYHWYGFVLQDLGRFAEARDSLATAVSLNPLSGRFRSSYARSLRIEGLFEEALEELHKAVLDYPPALVSIATMQFMVFNRYDEAVRNYGQYLTSERIHTDVLAELALVYLDLAQPDRSELLIEKSTETAAQSWMVEFGNALLLVYQGKPEGATVFAGSANGRPGMDRWGWIRQFCIALLRNHALNTGQASKALELYYAEYPELKTGLEPKVDFRNYRAAIDLALVMQRLGEREKATLLLDRASEIVSKRERLGWHGGFWVSDVQILALKGKSTEAIAALQTAANDGWRSLWWYYLRHDPNLDSIRVEPEFQAIVAEIESDMASQMQRIVEMEQAGNISNVEDLLSAAE